MSKFTVDSFIVELGFSENVIKGLQRVEKAALQSAQRIEKNLNKGFKINTKQLDSNLTSSLKSMEGKINKTFDRLEARAKNSRVFRFTSQVNDVINPPKQPRPRRVTGDRAITAAYSANMSKLKGFDPILQKYIKSQFYGLSAKAGSMDNTRFNEALAKLNSSVREAIAKARGHTSTSINGDRAASSLDSLSSAAVKTAGAFISFQAVLSAYQRVMGVGLQRASSERSIDFVFGDQSTQVKKFIQDLTQITGMDTTETQAQFASFGASAKNTMGLEGAEELFKNLTGYARLMGRSDEQIQRALTAVSQMASKGQVMSEELKGQLSEALPGATQAFAKALGLTEKQLFDKMKNGDVKASDALPKFAKELGAQINSRGGWKAIQDSTQTMLGNLKNTWNNSLTDIFRGSEDGLQDFTRSLTTLLNSLGGSGKTLGESLGSLMSDMSHGIDDLTTISYRVQGFFDRVTLAYRELNDTQKAVADGIANGLLSALKGLAGIVAVRSGIGAVGGIWNLIRAISTLGNAANTAAGRINSRSAGSVEGGKGKLSVADAITKVMIVGMATDVINAIVKPFYERQMSKSDNPIDKVVRSKVEPTDQALTGDMNSLATVLWAMVQGKSKDVPQFSPEALNSLKGRVETFTQDLKVIKPSVNIQPQTINITTQTVLDGKVIDERTTSHINRMQEDTLISSAYPEE
ncbi:tape measure protein [Escherichia coli]|uniref:tape measure protein n=1 Tax=Escherichia coli TaxID=562 RepID=UPI0010CC24CF|nr:tape measure protein [Escherichia coli]EEX2062117.1 tape measure protein [Escherichia coli]EEX9974521.1 tape measure protein [Escherichia coli]EEY3282193.1 tape measure protein [Escherichia coli]EEZ0609314.1 tape measure protein [Escherichia coli]EFA6144511.1 tape measure protein [Escherichia coli]